MNHWLVKSESDVYSIDHLERDKVTCWDCVRNYQARNFLRDMKVGDLVLFYHSNSDPSGVVGIAKVSKVAYPDPTQFDKRSEYFDEKATKDEPRWFSPDIRFVKKFPQILPLAELRLQKALKNMTLLQKGSRLSVQKVTRAEFDTIVKLAER